MSRPLRLNRDYNLLWASRALSEFGTQTSVIAFQLLTLAVTGSPAVAGLVVASSAAARLVASLPAGAVADRWDRRRVMLACEAAQAVALVSLVFSLWSGAANVYHIAGVAIVLGACLALFESAESAALPQVVAPEQLSTAVAMNSARSYFGQLAGTALSGFLFAARRFLPFLMDAVTHVVSWVLLLFVRLPEHTPKPESRPRMLGEIGTGLAWVWRHRFMRLTAFCSFSLNLLFQGFYVIVISSAYRHGVPTAEIGLLGAMLGVGGLLGALAAPRLQRRFRAATTITGVFWVLAVAMPLMILASTSYQMGAVLAALSFLAPTVSTAVNTYQILLTPDDMRGRLSGVMNLVNGLATVIGPTAGGLVIATMPTTEAILACSAAAAAVALVATTSSAIRGFTGEIPSRAAGNPVCQPTRSEEKL